MDPIMELKKAYNKTLERHGRASQYMDNNDIPLREREKLLPKLVDIQKRLGNLLDNIKVYTKLEALNGFEIND